MILVVVLFMVAVVLSTIIAYYYTTLAYAYIDEELNTHEEMQDALFAYVADDIEELIDAIDTLQARVQALEGPRTAGIYDQNGMMLFASPVEEYVHLDEHDFDTLDEAITHGLDGTLDDEG